MDRKQAQQRLTSAIAGRMICEKVSMRELIREPGYDSAAATPGTQEAL